MNMLTTLMDKETIVLMLRNVKQTASIGPEPRKYKLGERVIFALDHGLLERSDIGNFMVTPKGEDLLAGNLDWENL